MTPDNQPQSGPMMAYVTAATRDEALKIGRTLVEERLAACANVIGGMTSIYRWQGAMQQDAEAVLILKTRAELLETLVERVKALHGYTLPCVVAWPIAAGNPPYLAWLADETRQR
jgi:periplasmic divalent cation tolerance protein